MMRIIFMVIYVYTMPSWASKYETTGTKHTQNELLRALFLDDDNFSNLRSHFQMLNTVQPQTSNDQFYPSQDLSDYGYYVKRSF